MDAVLVSRSSSGPGSIVDTRLGVGPDTPQERNRILLDRDEAPCTQLVGLPFQSELSEPSISGRCTLEARSRSSVSLTIPKGRER